MTKKPTAGMALISALVPDVMRDGLRTLGGGNLSEGLRLAVTSPTKTSSGAQWVEASFQLPDACEVDGPLVLATPAGVVAHGFGPSSLCIDTEEGTLSVVLPDGGVSREFALSDLASLAGRLTGAVLSCCAPDGSVNEFGHELPCGLLVSRLSRGLVFIGVQGNGASVVLPIHDALQLAAEVVALLARRFEHHQLAVKGFSAAMASDSAEVKR
jgi:hypothetical protein